MNAGIRSQTPLPLESPEELAGGEARRPTPKPLPTTQQRLSGLDQVLTTKDVARIANRHRCTIHRWIKAGMFPPKRAGKGNVGWLRSDIQRWLAGQSFTSDD